MNERNLSPNPHLDLDKLELEAIEFQTNQQNELFRKDLRSKLGDERQSI